MKPSRGAPALVLLFLLLAGLSGCLETPDGARPRTTNGTEDGGDGGDGHDRRWTNPYTFPVHFDGWAAYDLALAQMYEDPRNHSGPRYRIPGTADHAAVALELVAELDAAIRPLGGEATISAFDGTDYYALDLAVVRHYTADSYCSDGARERVQGLEFKNIVARTDADQVGYIIGAHWDSKRHAMGSDEPILAGDDGAASVAAVVQLAHAFAAADPGIPLTFVLFDGEDGFEPDDCHPLAGSLHYAQSLDAAERETVEGMILLDMIGNASATFYREGYSKRYDGPAGTVRGEWLGDIVWETAAAMQVEAFVDRNTGSVYDDHIPFLYAGIPAIDIIRYENGFAPYWHTTADDHSSIQPEGIDQVGAVVEAALRRIATGDASS